MIALETWLGQNQRAFFVTDKTIMERFRPGWVYDTTDKEPEQADTIPELTTKLGLDPNELDKTVKEFSVACNQNPFDLMKLDGKATTELKPNKSNWANQIDTPPYFGCPPTASLTFTYGGVKTKHGRTGFAHEQHANPGVICSGRVDRSLLSRILPRPLRYFDP
jgi:hypothetical protein